MRVACSRRSVSKQRRDSTERARRNKLRKNKAWGTSSFAPRFLSRRSVGTIAPLLLKKRKNSGRNEVQD